MAGLMFQKSDIPQGASGQQKFWIGLGRYELDRKKAKGWTADQCLRAAKKWAKKNGLQRSLINIGASSILSLHEKRSVPLRSDIKEYFELNAEGFAEVAKQPGMEYLLAMLEAANGYGDRVLHGYLTFLSKHL
jgi:hypothetical protein